MKLEALRKTQGLSQHDAATRMGLTQTGSSHFRVCGCVVAGVWRGRGHDDGL